MDKKFEKQYLQMQIFISEMNKYLEKNLMENPDPVMLADLMHHIKD